MKRDHTLNYEGLQLPDTLNHILEQDFWLLDNISGATLSMLRLPMKFTSATSIFVRKGTCTAEINLRKYEICAPCVVNIAPSQIMQPLSISEDFEGAFMVMSQRLVNDMGSMMPDRSLLTRLKEMPVIAIAPQYLTDFEFFYRHLRSITSNDSNKYGYEAILHTLLAFLFEKAPQIINTSYVATSTASNLTTRFMRLAQEHFKKERFMEFYAKELNITPKHLGRTIKMQTGFSASEWLDRLVILEAKVLLKSTNMTIQQVAEELNFTSQSFFGKYFKNIVGISPKEFRNS